MYNELLYAFIAFAAALSAAIPAAYLTRKRIRVVKELLWFMKTDQYEYIIIDLRHPSDFARGRISRARNIPLSNITQCLPTENMSARIYTCGCNGLQARKAAKILDATGYFNVQSLGSFRLWKGPVELGETVTDESHLSKDIRIMIKNLE